MDVSTHQEGRFLADGAYDGSGVSDCLAAAFGYEVDVVVPPPKNAIPGSNCQRNQHLEHIAKHGRMGWQAATGYNQRSRIETQIGCWKSVIGDRLHAKKIENQTTETHIAASVLNRMSDLGRPNYEHVRWQFAERLNADSDLIRPTRSIKV